MKLLIVALLVFLVGGYGCTRALDTFKSSTAGATATVSQAMSGSSSAAAVEDHQGDKISGPPGRSPRVESSDRNQPVLTGIGRARGVVWFAFSDGSVIRSDHPSVEDFRLDSVKLVDGPWLFPVANERQRQEQRREGPREGPSVREEGLAMAGEGLGSWVRGSDGVERLRDLQGSPIQTR